MWEGTQRGTKKAGLMSLRHAHVHPGMKTHMAVPSFPTAGWFIYSAHLSVLEAVTGLVATEVSRTQRVLYPSQRSMALISMGQTLERIKLGRPALSYSPRKAIISVA